MAETSAIFGVFRGRKDENAAIFAILEPATEAMATAV
jgi:hypothetical protein